LILVLLIASVKTIPLFPSEPLPPELEERAQRLMKMIRCPVCESQSVAESTSFLANEIRDRIRTFLSQGKSDGEILNYFRERYGDEILLLPQGRGGKLFLWIPAIFFLLGLGVVALYLASLQRRRAEG
jgi:cytochrome c-type biogenesis protein CcmH